MMKFPILIALVAGCMVSATSAADAGFPEIKIAEPVERESTGGCRNPVADAWGDNGGLDLMEVAEKVREQVEVEAKPTLDPDLYDLPAYLREDH